MIHPDKDFKDLQERLTRYLNNARDESNNDKLIRLNIILEDMEDLDLLEENKILYEENTLLRDENKALKESIAHGNNTSNNDSVIINKLKDEINHLKKVNKALSKKLFDLLNN